jgi:endonuclease I
MMKKAIQVLTVCLIVAFMSSCQTQTKEEKVISKMKALAERVESNNETYSDAEWEKVTNEFDALQKEAKECDFSADQLKDLAKVEAELTTAIAKQGAKRVGSDIKDAIEEGKEMLDGVIDGIKEGLGGGDEAAEE